MAVGGAPIFLSIYEPILRKDVSLCTAVLFTVVGSVIAIDYLINCVYGFSCGLVTLFALLA